MEICLVGSSSEHLTQLYMLDETAAGYGELVSAMLTEMKSNNARFFETFKKIVISLWGREKNIAPLSTVLSEKNRRAA